MRSFKNWADHVLRGAYNKFEGHGRGDFWIGPHGKRGSFYSISCFCLGIMSLPPIEFPWSCWWFHFNSETTSLNAYPLHTHAYNFLCVLCYSHYPGTLCIFQKCSHHHTSNLFWGVVFNIWNSWPTTALIDVIFLPLYQELFWLGNDDKIGFDGLTVYTNYWTVGY